MTFWSVWAKILCHCVYLIALYFSTNSSQIRPETIGDFSIFLWLVVCAVHPHLSIMDVQGLQDTFTSGLMSWGALAHRWRLQASQFWESLTQRTLAIPWLVQGCTALAGLLVRKFELRYVCSVISVLLLCARCQASLWEHREVGLLWTSPHNWSDLAAAAAAAHGKVSMEDKCWHTMKCVHSTTSPGLKLGIRYLGV